MKLNNSSSVHYAHTGTTFPPEPSQSSALLSIFTSPTVKWLTWGIKNILHHMDHTVSCHQVTGRHVHRVDLDSVVHL